MSDEHGTASYREAGVDYDALDAGKRMAMAKALSTSPLLQAHGARALDASRGEPAFVFELDGRTFAFVVEGLGTKSIVARQVLERHGINRFADVAYDTVAAILNDLCCVGALPLVVNAYFATGASEWYADAARSEALLEGWRRACADAGCAWGEASRRRCRDCSTRATSSWPAPPSARCLRAGRRSSASGWRRAMRSCSFAPAACTPTAPRWRG